MDPENETKPSFEEWVGQGGGPPVDVNPEWFKEWVNVDTGYVIPRRFPWTGSVTDRAPDPIKVELDIEIRDGRARALKVCVSSERPLGVGSLTLRAVPIREFMAGGVRYYLHRIEWDGETPIRVPVPDDDTDAPFVVKKLVGYVEVTE